MEMLEKTIDRSEKVSKSAASFFWKHLNGICHLHDLGERVQNGGSVLDYVQFLPFAAIAKKKNGRRLFEPCSAEPFHHIEDNYCYNYEVNQDADEVAYG